MAIKILVDSASDISLKEAKEMGKNGRYLVENKYNWNILEKRLLDMYEMFEVGVK